MSKSIEFDLNCHNNPCILFISINLLISLENPCGPISIVGFI